MPVNKQEISIRNGLQLFGKVVELHRKEVDSLFDLLFRAAAPFRFCEHDSRTFRRPFAVCLDRLCKLILCLGVLAVDGQKLLGKPLHDRRHARAVFLARLLLVRLRDERTELPQDCGVGLPGVDSRALLEVVLAVSRQHLLPHVAVCLVHVARAFAVGAAERADETVHVERRIYVQLREDIAVQLVP